MGMQKISPPHTFTSDQSSQWYKLQALIASLLAGSGFSTVAYVDVVTGNDDSAEVGSTTFKYQTIQAALDAVPADSVVLVSPGTYTENLVWPNTNNITLMGSGKTSTYLVNAAAGATIMIAPTIALARATVRDMIVDTTGAVVMEVNGTLNANIFTQGFHLVNVHAPNGQVNFYSINEYEIESVQGSTLGIFNCGPGPMYDSQWNNVGVIYETAPVEPPASGRGILYGSSIQVYNELSVQTLGAVAFGKDTQVGTITGTIEDTATACGYIWMAGNVPGIAGVSVNVTFVLTNNDTEIIRLDYALVGGTVTVDDAGGSTNRAKVNLRHAELLDTTGPHTAGDLTDIDLRGGLFTQGSLAVAGTGTIDRTHWYITEADGDGAASFGVAIAPPYPIGTTDYEVNVEGDVLADLPVQIDTKVAAQFNRTKTADNGALRFLLTRPFD